MAIQEGISPKNCCGYLILTGARVSFSFFVRFWANGSLECHLRVNRPPNVLPAEQKPAWCHMIQGIVLTPGSENSVVQYLWVRAYGWFQIWKQWYFDKV